MSCRVQITHQTMEVKRDEIEVWLRENAGVGSARYSGKEGVINHWLNGEDYCYYNQRTLGDLGDLEHSDTVFVFRDERLATEFALRFI